ncbi:MAG: antibiotic ABC transporter permease [Halapricum sp.]
MASHTSGAVQAALDARSTDREIQQLFTKTLAYARDRDYTGWDYGDGMSSRLLQWLPVENKWVNLAVQELVKRPPVNLRPLFLVEQRRSYQGTALFAMANRNYDRLLNAEGESDFRSDFDPLSETEALLDWLLDERIQGYSGFCGGHRHRLQHLDGGIGEPSDPDVVSTSYAVRALLGNADLDARYADVARSAADFVIEDLRYREVDDGAVINYHMNHDDEIYTINAGALGARLLLDLYDYFDDPEYFDRAQALLDHIAGLQTDLGGWTYRDPPDSSHLSMDSHHNGFVIESFQRYAELADSDRYAETYDRAMRFYRTLFEADGAPNFDEYSRFPRDIHASSQGILVFSYAGEFDRARRLVEWVRQHLYVGGGRYYFRKQRYYTQRITLMRWCEAWMAYALSEFLRLSGPGPRRQTLIGQ